MLEILRRLLSLASISEQGSQVDASAEVLVVVEETRLEQLNTALVVFLFLMNDSEVKVGVYVGDRLLDGFIVELGCFVVVLLLLSDPTESN